MSYTSCLCAYRFGLLIRIKAVLLFQLLYLLDVPFLGNLRRDAAVLFDEILPRSPFGSLLLTALARVITPASSAGMWWVTVVDTCLEIEPARFRVAGEGCPRSDLVEG
jgi:hypothetical protein